MNALRPALTPAQWRSAALIALWALVVATFGLVAWQWAAQPLTEGRALGGLRSFLAALVLVWWTQVFTRYTLGEGVPDTNGTLRALKLLTPWLLAMRLALWSLNVLGYASGAAPEANTVAVTAILTIELGFLLAKNAVFGTLARHAGNPAEVLGSVRLMQWLNLAAPLALALGVVNVVPVAGLAEPGAARDLTQLFIYGAHALLDMTAMVLALRAVQVMPRVDA